MNIMYQCNDNFAYIAGTSILSLLENNRSEKEIIIFLISDSISALNRNRLQKIVDDYGRTLIFIDKPNMQELIDCKVRLGEWIDNIFSKVFLEEILKDYPEVKRIIYIDSDTLILDSLNELWNLDMLENVGAGVCEAMGDLHKQAIGLSRTDNYFNSGVLLIDVEKWRKGNFDNKAREFIKCKKGKFEYPEECVLNGILAKKILKLSPEYNVTSLSIYFSIQELKRYRKSSINYTESERQKALHNIKIIHFTSTYVDTRPWVENCRHPYAPKWIAYKEKTPWMNTPLIKDQRSKLQQLVRYMVLMLPDSLRIELTGFIHAYIKPLKFL